MPVEGVGTQSRATHPDQVRHRRGAEHAEPHPRQIVLLVDRDGSVSLDDGGYDVGCAIGPSSSNLDPGAAEADVVDQPLARQLRGSTPAPRRA